VVCCLLGFDSLRFLSIYGFGSLRVHLDVWRNQLKRFVSLFAFSWISSYDLGYKWHPFQKKEENNGTGLAARASVYDIHALWNLIMILFFVCIFQ
jgi:hypothetical protein